ncbi:spermidine synthase [Adlercreutzia sp. ZJ138]|uniref:spermidine synthase n=1 Tax=Adlercreutzia sp. ZJ138 TaxID=2709405 RepID=UPI0013EA9EF2|nr:fused MFS/spermidine synthase [Adlercreutzia sp. ZJ138]
MTKARSGKSVSGKMFTSFARRGACVAGVAAGVAGAVAGFAAVQTLRRQDIHLIPHAQAGLAVVRTVRDEAEEPVRVLSVGGAYQSATYFGERWHEPVLEYYRAFDHMFEAEHGDGNTNGNGDKDGEVAPFCIRDVLMIGGGGCAWPKHVLMGRPDVHVDVVESDPVIIDVAKRYFYVDELVRVLCEREGSSDRFRLINDDGLAYLAGCEQRYDAIVNDAFSGKAAAADLASAMGIRAVKNRLNPGGLYLVNVVSGSEWREFRHLVRLLNELDRQFAFADVILATDDRFSNKDNYLVIASDAKYHFSDVIPVGGVKQQ